MSADTQVKCIFDTPSHEWMVYRNEKFGVKVRSFPQGNGFGWNVYALIYDSHPLFADVQRALNLPFHWGPTLDKFISEEPAQGIRYDWQKVGKYLKVGSDYQHLHDDEFQQCDPVNGIPHQIRRDAEELVNALLSTTSKLEAA